MSTPAQRSAAKKHRPAPKRDLFDDPKFWDFAPLDDSDDFFEIEIPQVLGVDLKDKRGTGYAFPVREVRKARRALGRPDAELGADIAWWSLAAQPELPCGDAPPPGSVCGLLAAERGPWYLYVLAPFEWPWAASHITRRLAS